MTSMILSQMYFFLISNLKETNKKIILPVFLWFFFIQITVTRKNSLCIQLNTIRNEYIVLLNSIIITGIFELN
jgi:hypothetical protein